MNQTQKIEELEATIAKAQQQIEELKKPKIERFKPKYHDRYHAAHWRGKVVKLCWGNDFIDQRTYDFFNCYETDELAEKAIPLMRRSNAIIMAKLMVDPAFKPDWSDTDQDKWCVYYNYIDNGWKTFCYSYADGEPAHASTQEKAEQMGELLTKWGVLSDE